MWLWYQRGLPNVNKSYVWDIRQKQAMHSSSFTAQTPNISQFLKIFALRIALCKLTVKQRAINIFVVLQENIRQSCRRLAVLVNQSGFHTHGVCFGLYQRLRNGYKNHS